MAFIGNTVQTQGFTPAIDYFNGNGVTVTFTLSRPIASVAQVIVAVDNVIQNPSSAFGVVGNSITFTSAPLSGTNNIWVEYTSLITTYQGISQDPTVIGDIRATGGYLAEGDFGNSFVDGNLIDYVTGAGRLTVGELDDLVFYHGGTSARSEMMRLSYAGNSTLAGGLSTTGNVGIGSTATTYRLNIQNTSTTAFDGLQVAGDNASYNLVFQAGSVSTSGTLFGVNRARGQFITSNNSPITMGTLDAFPLTFGTNLTARMTIDSSGRVTTPAQPMFYARKDTSQTIPSATLITFTNVTTNIGSHYNSSTSRFTAPVSGVYSFSARVIINRTGLAYANINPCVNGTPIPAAGAYYDSAINNTGFANYGQTLQYYLNAGDYVDWTVGCPSGTVGVDNSGYFCGFLVG